LPKTPRSAGNLISCCPNSAGSLPARRLVLYRYDDPEINDQKLKKKFQSHKVRLLPNGEAKKSTISLRFQSHNGSIVTKPKFGVSGAKQRERCSKRLTVGSEHNFGVMSLPNFTNESPSPHGRVETYFPQYLHLPNKHHLEPDFSEGVTSYATGKG
jgi:hypothetical protein